MVIETSWLAVYRAVLVIAVLLGLAGIYFAFDQRDKPGGTPLIVLFTGGMIYVGTKLAVSIVRGTPPVFIITRFNPLGAGLATVGFFFMVLEYTGIEQPISRLTAALLLIFPALVNILVWLDVEYLWIPTGRDAGTLSGHAWELTSIAIANQLYMNLLLIVGFALLIRFGLQSATPFRLQAGTLVLAGFGPLLGNFLFYIGHVPFNLAPIMFVFSGVGMLGLLVRGRFLDLVPVSRDVVYHSLETGVLTIDTDHRVIDINSSAREVFGFDADDELIGQHVEEVFADQPAIRDMYWSSTDMDSGEVFEMEFDGRYYGIEATDVRRIEGSMIGRSFMIRDTTAQQKRKQALERKNDELERLVSVMSHDIGNPLHVIQGHVQLARGDEDVEPYLDRIESSANRIEAIMNDTLTLRRGADRTNTDQINITTVAERAWTHVDTENVTLETACSVSVEADPDRLEQLFENLFRNAIDHGKSVTTVRVGEIVDTDRDASGFFIEDDGVGIPEDDREAVLEDGYTTTEAGTGLGLSIISEIIDAHGWQLRITESEAGGARFEIIDVETLD
jgi:PAS domain S-box-containing protein